LLNEYKLHYNDPKQLQEAGYRFECRGNYEQAIAIYKDLLQRFPKYKERLYLRDRLITLQHDLGSDYVATQAQSDLLSGR
jgi:tetratricopeptide (TPR) repeat protein